MSSFFIVLFTAYLAGSINFSIILFKIFKKQDPRTQFSKNPGVTNIYRQAGIFWAGIIFFLEITRAMVIAGIATNIILPEYIIWIGFGLILGNSFPCFHKFKGGKGVAGFLGFTIFIAPVFALISIFLWLISYVIFKTPFISSFCMIFVLSIGWIIKFKNSIITTIGTVIIVFFIIFRHKENILKIKKHYFSS